LGFHSYWLPENHFEDHRAIPSPLTLLAAASGRTSRIGLATTSYLLPIRHPIQAAEEVAVLDQLCSGRLILGLGRGLQKAMFDVFGAPGNEKRARFRNHLDTMISAWRGDAIHRDEDGAETFLAPLPLQRPHPPLWVAAFGPLALKQVGGLGLPYLCSPIEPLSRLAANYKLYREAAKEAGKTLAPVVPVMRTVLITENDRLASRVRDRLASSAPRRFQGGDVPVGDWAIVGDPHYARDRLSEYVETLEISHLIGGGRLPAIDERDQLKSHEWLLEIGEVIASP
jgi:alkanesulfonate monooxygenase SsuD/methylene tetrahydromethanopterin reductase-like flavin-dependent oxidoreductase (luciferase family)